MGEHPEDGKKPVHENSLDGSLKLRNSPGIRTNPRNQSSKNPTGRKNAADQQRGRDDRIVLRPDHSIRRGAEHVGMNQQHRQPEGGTRSAIRMEPEKLYAVKFEQEEPGRGRQPQTRTDLTDVLTISEEGSPR